MTKESLKKIFLILGIAFLLTAGQAWAEPPTETENNGAEVIEARREADNDQTETEAEEFARLQEEDRKACEAEEAAEYAIEQSGGGRGQGQEDPYSPTNPDSPYSDGRDPEADDDNDGIPNGQDEDADGDGTRDADEPVTTAPVCEQKKMAAYITANEGWRNERYSDSKGYWTIGIGHLITGNEPSDIKKAINETGSISDEQVKELFRVDLQTHKNIAMRIAGEFGVNWGSLSEGRQIVLADMAFTLGYPKFVKFEDTWGAIARAQKEDTELNWRDAAREILDSNYASDVKSRANRNANIMGAWDEDKEKEAEAQDKIIIDKINSEPKARTMCGDVTAWSDPLKFFAQLFQTPIALAQGLYVPVIEQDGELRRDTQNIRENTTKIEEHTDATRILSIQICTHLRAIRRIQSRFEQKMVEDAQTKRIKNTELEKYRQAVFGDDGFVKTGYKTLDAEGNDIPSPLFVTNQKTYWEINELEGEEIALNNIKESENPYSEEIIAILKSSNPLSLYSSITDKDVENLTNPERIAKSNSNSTTNFAQKRLPIITSLAKPLRHIAFFITGDMVWAADPPDTEESTSLDYWSSWLKLIEPKNNRFGSLAIALDNVGIEKNLAINAAREEAAQGQGFLPIRECLEKSSDGKTCLTWGTKQPGIIIEETMGKAINSRVDTYIAADEKGDVAEGNEPNITEIVENKPAEGGGGAVGPGMTEPDSIPDSNQDMESDVDTNTDGDTGGGSTQERDVESSDNWGDLSDFLDINFDTSDSSDDVNLSSIRALINAILEQFGSILELIRPIIIFNHKEKSDGTQLIYWFSLNAYNCYANNDWPSSTVAGEVAIGKDEKLTSEIKEGALIGSLRVTPPTSGTKYEIRCENGNGKRVKNIKI